jgi:DNA-binding GntR family transcriptional regulator
VQKADQVNPSPSARAVRSRGELTEALAARILDHINTERLPAGTHIAAQDLADRFSVSRSPVNQALRLLHAKRVLAHERNRGYFVGRAGRISAQEIGLPAEDHPGRAYLQIADDRLHGRLPAQVPESQLRERYGLTKTQLAAVLTRISQEGWAERRPGYGWEFSEMLVTPEALLQTYRVRMALEPAALLEPGYRLAPVTVERLRATELRLLDGALDTDSPDALHERGVRFHEGIVGACRNPFFLDSLRRINRVRRLLSYRSMVVRDRYREQCREHLDILGLLEQGRNTEAAEALRAHLVTTVRNLDRIRPLMEH